MIPICICNLQFLKYFYVNDNNLTGSLPACLANVSELIEIHSYCTGLSGGIPALVETLPYLSEFKTECNPMQNCTSPMQNMSVALSGDPFDYLCGVDATCNTTCVWFNASSNLTNTSTPPTNTTNTTTNTTNTTTNVTNTTTTNSSCTTELNALLSIFNTNGGDFWVNASLWGVATDYCTW